MTKIEELQLLPIRELLDCCIENNISLGLETGGIIEGLYPLVEVKPLESYDHCIDLELKRLDA